MYHCFFFTCFLSLMYTLHCFFTHPYLSVVSSSKALFHYLRTRSVLVIFTSILPLRKLVALILAGYDWKPCTLINNIFFLWQNIWPVFRICYCGMLCICVFLFILLHEVACCYNQPLIATFFQIVLSITEHLLMWLEVTVHLNYGNTLNSGTALITSLFFILSSSLLSVKKIHIFLITLHLLYP